jgi:Kef-type K+ transport system membrane component KefB
MINVLLLFFVVILVTFIFGEIFARLKFPRIVGQITAGLFLGIPLFSGVFPVESQPGLLLLSELGIIFLLMLTGLEIDMKQIKKSSLDVVAIAFSSVLFSFLFGFAFAILIGQSLMVAFVLGACLSLTSEATKSIALMQRNALKTKLGEIMIMAGTVDNIFELLFLSLLLVLVGTGGVRSLVLLPLEIIGFFVAAFIALKLIPRFMGLFEPWSEDKYFTLSIIIGLGIALLSSTLSLGPIVGALVAGLLLQKAFKSQKIEHAVEDNLKVITFGLIVPFFYLQIGLNFNLQAVWLYPAMALAVLVLAFAGKMLGTLVVKPITRLRTNQLVLVGWGMNSRGVIELVIAEIARQNIPGFPMELYAAIVFMSIATTFAFPIALKYYLQKYPAIMDE